MSDAEPTTYPKVKRPSKSSVAAKLRRKSYETCQVCYEKMERVTSEHLKAHGFTRARYEAIYLQSVAATSPSPASLQPRAPSTSDDPTDAAQVPRKTVLDLARRIVEDPQVIRELAGEVADAIFSSGLREQLRLSLVALLAQRLEAHGRAAARLADVRDELTQTWRIRQGGKNGTPTSNRDLAAIHNALLAEVKQSEDLLTRTVKLAIDEFRALGVDGDVPGGLRYTAGAERVPIPADLSPSDREAIRQILAMVDGAVGDPNTVDAEVVTDSSRMMSGAADVAEDSSDMMSGVEDAAETADSPLDVDSGSRADVDDPNGAGSSEFDDDPYGF